MTTLAQLDKELCERLQRSGIRVRADASRELVALLQQEDDPMGAVELVVSEIIKEDRMHLVLSM